MLRAISHRGPDDWGTLERNGLGLGIRRLSILDVEGGHQPMTNEDGSVIVVCNGEIYNFRELRQQLVGRGHRFSTSCDTEVIAHLYEEYGLELVHRLRGMFALAVWDDRKRRLLLARDRLGIKPLYVADDGARLLFGSEIKAILAHPSMGASLDTVAVSQYLSLRYVPAPRTMLSGISALPPGARLVCDESGVRIERWWDLPMEPSERGDEDELTERLDQELREAVALHLQSDVPFGAFLSGGVDSSLVVALMSEVLPDPVRTYAVGFEADGVRSGELPYAAMMARHAGTVHHELVMTGADFVDAAERAVWHLDQPLGDAATIPMLLLSELAARDVKMVLSGEGGDELFAGYARYVGDRISPALRAVPDPIRRRALTGLGRAARSTRQRNVLYALSQSDEASRLLNWFPLFNDELKHELVHRDLLELDGSSPAAVMERILEECPTQDRLGRMLYLDTKLWLPDLLLARGDKMSMAASLELRVPLLDHHVAEFAARLPSRIKIRGRERKRLLRRVARSRLPGEILDRPKEGFPVPVSAWLRSEARPLLYDTLSPATLRRRGLLEPAFVAKLIDQHDTGQADHGFLLWGLVGLELWHRRFLEP